MSTKSDYRKCQPPQANETCDKGGCPATAHARVLISGGSLVFCTHHFEEQMHSIEFRMKILSVGIDEAGSAEALIVGAVTVISTVIIMAAIWGTAATLFLGVSLFGMMVLCIGLENLHVPARRTARR